MSNNWGQTKICVEKILPKHQAEIDALKKKSNSDLHYTKLLAAFYTSKLWPAKSTIRIGFMETGNQIPRTPLDTILQTAKENGSDLQIDGLQKAVEGMSVQEAIRKIVRERIQPIVNLNLVFVDNIAQANVRISFNPNGGAWSLIGTDCLHEPSAATINFGWFDVATVIHEFGHMLGMIHEHQNPKSNPIAWDDGKVFAWAKSTQ